jgi:hypothetical protein
MGVENSEWTRHDSSRVDCLHGMILGRLYVFTLSLLASIVSHHPLTSHMGLHSLFRAGLSSSLAQLDPSPDAPKSSPASQLIGEDINRMGLLSTTSAVLSHVAFLRRKIRSIQIGPQVPLTQEGAADQPPLDIVAITTPEPINAGPADPLPPSPPPNDPYPEASFLLETLRSSVSYILTDSASGESTGDEETERCLASMLRCELMPCEGVTH